ncbi:MAG: hypothetical protein IIU47_09690, partial [Lachnospiraceae bacterium]|nr:hypothetical protein [Lachnospiraceae bacterium]
ESHALELPILPAGLEWRIYASSDRMEKKGSRAADRKLVLEPRSLTVLVSEKEKQYKGHIFRPGKERI